MKTPEQPEDARENLPEEKPVDWLHFVKNFETGAELDLRELQPGDILQVETRNTCYTLRIVGFAEAELSTNRPDRPSGRVVIQGCTFGWSSSIKPDHLFCGGNLELTFDEGRMVHRTTTIRALRTVRKQA